MCILIKEMVRWWWLRAIVICSYINTLPTYRWIGRMWAQRYHAWLTRWHPHWHTWTATLLTMHQFIISKQRYVHQAWIWRIENSSIFTPSSTIEKMLRERERAKNSRIYDKHIKGHSNVQVNTFCFRKPKQKSQQLHSKECEERLRIKP